MPLSPQVPDDAERNPWTAPAAESCPAKEIDPARLGPLHARRTTFRLIALGFLVLGLLELFLAFVSGENSRKFWAIVRSRGEEGLGGGSALDYAVALTALALILAVLGILHLALLAGLWRGARWARVATIGVALVFGPGMLLALLLVGDRDGGLGWAAAIGSGVIGGGGYCGLALLLMSPRSKDLVEPGVAAALWASPRPRRPLGRKLAGFFAGLSLLVLALVLAVATAAFFLHFFMLLA